MFCEFRVVGFPQLSHTMAADWPVIVYEGLQQVVMALAALFEGNFADGVRLQFVLLCMRRDSVFYSSTHNGSESPLVSAWRQWSLEFFLFNDRADKSPAVNALLNLEVNFVLERLVLHVFLCKLQC